MEINIWVSFVGVGGIWKNTWFLLNSDEWIWIFGLDFNEYNCNTNEFTTQREMYYDFLEFSQNLNITKMPDKNAIIQF